MISPNSEKELKGQADKSRYLNERSI